MNAMKQRDLPSRPMRPALTAMAEFWNSEIRRWVDGDHVLSPTLRRWQRSYNGRADGVVDLDVFPEPFIGPLRRSAAPALVMLGLNPGAPAPSFQGPNGIFTQQIARTSYSEWAASGPYTCVAWENANGRNKYHRDRAAFAQRLHQNESIRPEDLLYLELYPFHSRRVTGPIRPPLDLLQRFVFDSIAELDVEFVFAFGSPWYAAARMLTLGEGVSLEVAWSAPSRSARRYRINAEQSLIVLSQSGYAGPPGPQDTEALRQELMG